jgi:hypothetical protein
MNFYRNPHAVRVARPPAHANRDPAAATASKFSARAASIASPARTTILKHHPGSRFYSNQISS